MSKDRAYQELIAILEGRAPRRARPLAIHIIGATGTEGAALAELLYRRGGDQLEVVGHDFSEDPEESFARAHVALDSDERGAAYQRLRSQPGLRLLTGERYLSDIDQAELIFAGQNWRAYAPNAPALFEVHGIIPFAQMMDLYIDLAPCAMVGVTGTNGKTTTCNWIREMAASERASRVSGNDLFSPQSLGSLFELPSDGLLVLEVSNRQARDLRRSPEVVAVTSLAPDHLQEHGGLDGYVAAKRRLVELQTSEGVAILNRDDHWVRAFAEVAPGRLLWVSSEPLEEQLEGAYLGPHGELRLREAGSESLLGYQRELAVPGLHNLRNGLIAALCARVAGCSLEAVRAGLRSFRGVRNRLQLIARGGGIAYYNDLASTTPWATVAALRSFEASSLRVIIGGMAKTEAGYGLLADELGKRAAAVIALPGTASERVLAQLPGSVLCTQVESIDAAVAAATAQARSGDTVLLSPAGAGFYSAFLGRAGSFNRSVRRRLRRGQVA